MQDASEVMFNLDELRKENCTIKGISEKRIDEIMVVIEKVVGNANSINKNYS